jgi:hypothetical protein
MDTFTPVARVLRDRSVRYVVIGVGGANYWALSGATVFPTRDRDVFLPADPENLLRAWDACEAMGLSLWVGDEPLDIPHDRFIAERIVDRKMAVRATDGVALDVDLTLVMAGFDFETVWRERRTFVVDDVEIPVARLLHIVESKHAAGRDKDRLFLATHKEALQQLLDKPPHESL